MVSNEQRIEMLRKLALILETMKSCESIAEISEKTSIPTSTVQRYLNRKDLLIELLGNINTTNEVFEQNQIWLKKAYASGHKKGGLVSQERHGYEKGETGRFSGSGIKRA